MSDKKARNIHDRRFPQPAPVPAPAPASPSVPVVPVSPVALLKEEAEQVRALHTQLSGIKSVLAEACMNAGVTRAEIERLESILEQQNTEIVKIEAEAIKTRSEVTKVVDALARSHGIPVGDPNGGKWRVDVDKGVIVHEEPIPPVPGQN